VTDETLRPPADAARADRVRIARFERALANSSGNMLRLLGGAWFVTYVLYARADTVWLVTWNATLLVLIGAAVVYMRRHPLAGLTADQVQRVATVRMGLGALIGLAWGVFALVPITSEPLLYRTFLFVALSTVGAVSGIGLSVVLPYVYVLTFATLGPIILRLLFDGSEFGFFMGCGGVIWMGLILKTSHQIGRSQVAEIELQETLREEMQKLDETRQEVARLANHDTLTGLANRRLLEATFDRCAALARRTGRTFGLLVIDLDNFKPVNDRVGHHAGDRLLQAAAERLVACCREVDCVARTGGDEFAVLIDGVAAPADVEAVARRIVEALRRPFVVDPVSMTIGGSVGVAVWPRHGTSMEALMLAADRAMYRVKQEGRDGFRVVAQDEEPLHVAAARTGGRGDVAGQAPGGVYRPRAS